MPTIYDRAITEYDADKSTYSLSSMDEPDNQITLNQNDTLGLIKQLSAIFKLKKKIADQPQMIATALGEGSDLTLNATLYNNQQSRSRNGQKDVITLSNDQGASFEFNQYELHTLVYRAAHSILKSSPDESIQSMLANMNPPASTFQQYGAAFKRQRNPNFVERVNIDDMHNIKAYIKAGCPDEEIVNRWLDNCENLTGTSNLAEAGFVASKTSGLSYKEVFEIAAGKNKLSEISKAFTNILEDAPDMTGTFMDTVIPAASKQHLLEYPDAQPTSSKTGLDLPCNESLLEMQATGRTAPAFTSANQYGVLLAMDSRTQMPMLANNISPDDQMLRKQGANQMRALSELMTYSLAHCPENTGRLLQKVLPLESLQKIDLQYCTDLAEPKEQSNQQRQQVAGGMSM